MGHKPAVELSASEITFEGAGRWAGIFGAVGVIGLLVSVALGLGGGEHAREDFFRAYLTNYMFVLSLALGGLFFVLVQYLSRAGWSVTVRRLAEVMGWSILPLAPLALIIVWGMHDLYEWTHADVVATDTLLQGKEPWLNTNFFVLRLVIYFAVWAGFGWLYLRRSVAQDESRDPKITQRLERLAPAATILFALTVTYASFDLLMSLTPHWYSTIYGVYYFAGCFLGFFAFTILLSNGLQRAGKLTSAITAEHYHDLGKFMFAFVVFWAYIAFSQYMLIWYAHIPEETVWYEVRQNGTWLWLSVLLLFGHFFLPFFGLMSRYQKRRRSTLVLGAVWLLAMHWFDVFYLAVPGSRVGRAPVQLVDLTCFVGLLGIFLAVVTWRLGRAKLVPVGDPRLAESLGFENA